MKIIVDSFDIVTLAENFSDYGLDGDVDYKEGDSFGKLYTENGVYEFCCHFDSSEVELTNLIIEIDEIEEE